MRKRSYQPTHRPAPDYHLETLESRLLFSADAALVVADAGPHEAANVAVITSDVEISSEVNTQGTVSGAKALSTDANELVIIDAAVPDLDALLADFSALHDKPQVALLEAGGDALHQLGKLISESKGLTAVHIFSHGIDGELALGGERITTLDLLAQANEISDWGGAFVEGADILIYGCDVAASADGRNFVDTLARLTSTDVAASSDIAGAASRGGNWQLEYQHGYVQTDVVVSAKLQQDYEQTLATYTVTLLTDNATTTEVGSLRWAIEQANTGSGDIIRFSTSGTIMLDGVLPTITRRVEIDATTVPGYSGAPLVTLDGNNIGGTTANGLFFNAASADNSAVRGLAIVNMPALGIRINAADNIFIESNYIGTDGTTPLGNGDGGIGIYSAIGNKIGTPGNGNVISGNTQGGVYLENADDSVVQGNFIGTNWDDSANIPNGAEGILLSSGSSNNMIGGLTEAEGNIIRANTGAGISVIASLSRDNALLLNVISSNGGLGIDLGGDGVTANDGNEDSDSGPNRLQNYPVLTTALADDSGSILIEGNFESIDNSDYRLDFYYSTTGDGSRHGQAEYYIGTSTASTPTNGQATFSETFSAPLLRGGDAVTTTLTRLDGIGDPLETSE